MKHKNQVRFKNMNVMYVEKVMTSVMFKKVKHDILCLPVA